MTKPAKNNETKMKVDIAYLSLGRQPIAAPSQGFGQYLDARDLAKASSAELKTLAKSAKQMVTNFEKEPWFDEIQDVKAVLGSTRVERDGNGEIIMYPNQQLGGVPQARQINFDLDEQRFINRMEKCIQRLEKDNKENIVIEFHKNAELDVPNWEDALRLETLMHQSLNERGVIGIWFATLDDKVAEMGLQARRLLDAKRR